MSSIKTETVKEKRDVYLYRFTVETEGWRLSAVVNKHKRFSHDLPGMGNPWMPTSVYVEIPTKLTTLMARAVAELMPLVAEKAAELDKSYPT
jgi:hypothetical protein